MQFTLRSFFIVLTILVGGVFTYDSIWIAHCNRMRLSLIEHIVLNEHEYFGRPAECLTFGDPHDQYLAKPSSEIMEDLNLNDVTAVDQAVENTAFIGNIEWIGWNTARLNYGAIYSVNEWSESVGSVFSYREEEWQKLDTGEERVVTDQGCQF